MQYLKIHLTAFLTITFIAVVLIVWFWPAENNLNPKREMDSIHQL